LAFKNYVSGLSRSRSWCAAGITIAEDQIAEVDSQQQVILQCLDVILGSMQFRLNEKHREILPGARLRGKRTLAKERVYKHISASIRQIHPNFNIGISTGGDARMRWTHSYRHWLFKPTNLEIRPEYAKRK